MIRLNKYLSEAGVCSRREADRLIEAGRVTVDGVRAVPGMKVSEEQKICVGKKVIQGAEQKVVLAVNKCDRTGGVNPEVYEFYSLGLGDPIEVSAVHGHGSVFKTPDWCFSKIQEL